MATIMMDDATNLAIIGILTDTPRASNKSIATALGVAEASVAARIRMLQEKGIVRIALQQDTHASSESTVAALVEFFVDDTERMDEVAKAIAGFDEVFSAYTTARRPEIIANLRAGSPRELNDTIMRMAIEVPYLAQLRTLPILDLGLYSTTIGSLKSPAAHPAPRDVGEAMIVHLQEDGRQSVSSLARKLGLSVTAARSRMHTLLNRPGVRIGLICDAEALGYTVWFDLRICIAPANLAAALERFSEHPSVRVVAHLAGEANLELFLVTRTIAEVDDFVREDVRPLPGLIDFSMNRVTGVFKYDYNYNL